MTRTVIIVAGGKGLRMGSDLPKQFLPLGGRPVLMRTIETFYHYNKGVKIIVVLPEEQLDYWKEISKEHDFHLPHQVAPGGKTRFHSVQNGLKIADAGNEQEGLIAVHDGVRPLVSKETIGRCFDKAQESGVAYPVIPVVDTLRKKNGDASVLVDRNEYFLVQTPQVFYSKILREAYDQEFSEHFTDDVSVVEALGKYRVYEVEGDKYNIKITTPADLAVAEKMASWI